MVMSNDFYSSEVFRDLMLALQEKCGPIESYTVCHSFESSEYLAHVKEEGAEDFPDDEQLEVEYPDDDLDLWPEDVRYLDGVIPVYDDWDDNEYDDYYW